MNNTGKIVLGALAGVATGAILGVLFAPDKGSKTRRKLYKEGTNVMDDAKDKYEELLESLTDKFEEAKEKIHQMSR